MNPEFDVSVGSVESRKVDKRSALSSPTRELCGVLPLFQKITLSEFQLFAGKFAMTNIYIGNLAYKTTSRDLEKTFSEFGEVVSAQVVEDRDRGTSKGFGFVEMANSADAHSAVQNMDGQDLQGRNVKVNIARPREERSPRR